MNQKKMGRPPKKEGRQQYQRLAVYPETHSRIVVNAKKKGKHIVDYLDDLVPKKEK